MLFLNINEPTPSEIREWMKLNNLNIPLIIFRLSGIYSNENMKQANQVAEPVIYAFGSNLVGGFYRLHEDKNNSENLNSPGMTFHPIPFKDACISRSKK